MKKIVILLLIVIVSAAVLTHQTLTKPKPPIAAAPPQIDKVDTASDAYVRDAVVLLYGASRTCTGVQVEVAPGVYQVLTAAHCSNLLDDSGMVMARGEHGQEVSLALIAEDDHSDLMLLTGSEIFGHIKVAKKRLKLHDPVHTLTHGAGAPTYRTDGESLDEIRGGFVVSEIFSPEDMKECVLRAKHKVIKGGVFGGRYCVLDVMSLRATAAAVLGSSGGPILNAKGELVGITSYIKPSTPIFAYFVRLVDIQAFLKANSN